MKRPKNQISVISKSIRILDKCAVAKIYGRGRDHHDNDGIPPDEADRSDWKK